MQYVSIPHPYLYPATHQPMLLPQGVFGDLVARFAPTAGTVLGGVLGHPNAGAQIGNIAGAVGHLLPFSAQPVLAPQSVLGDVIGAAAPFLGHAAGTVLGYPNVGQYLGKAASVAVPVAEHLYQYAPSFRGIVGAALPSLVGLAGEVGSGLLPNHAALAPQGVFGDLIGGFAPAVGGAIGGHFGYANAGTQIGNAVKTVSHLLPFSAQPEVTLAPQGVLGSVIGALAPTVGSVVGGLFGHSNVGGNIGHVVGTVGSLLPFSAQPMLAPQGVFGDLIGKFAPVVGSAIGGHFGHPNAGTQIGNMVGTVSHLLPFSAQPTVAYY